MMLLQERIAGWQQLEQASTTQQAVQPRRSLLLQVYKQGSALWICRLLTNDCESIFELFVSGL